MFTANDRPVDASKILTKREITAVISDLTRKSKRALSSHQNLTIARLGICCGLRVSEMVKLDLQDVVLSSEKPFLRVRKSKRDKTRKVWLYLDAGCLDDITAWKDLRLTQGASPADPFICDLRAGHRGRRLGKRSVQARWTRIVHKVLEPERADEVSGIHSARHTAATAILEAGYSLAFLRDLLGHSNIQVTSRYLHHGLDDGVEVGDAFDFAA